MEWTCGWNLEGIEELMECFFGPFRWRKCGLDKAAVESAPSRSRHVEKIGEAGRVSRAIGHRIVAFGESLGYGSALVLWRSGGEGKRRSGWGEDPDSKIVRGHV